MTTLNDLQQTLDLIRNRLDGIDGTIINLYDIVHELGADIDALKQRVTTLEPVPSLSPSGEPMPGDLPGWKLSWAEDFNTDCPEGAFPTTYPNVGVYPITYLDTSKRGRYDPNILSVTGSVLRKRIHTTADGMHHVAAILPELSYDGKWGDVTQGRFAVRWRSDLIATYKQAWLLYPQTAINWPRDGEIDWPERALDEPAVYGYVHYKDAASGSDQAWCRVAGDFTQWHTTVIEWTPGVVVFTLDGKEIKRVTTRVPNVPLHWVLQTETTMDRLVSIDNNAEGFVEIDWLTFHSPVT